MRGTGFMYVGQSVVGMLSVCQLRYKAERRRPCMRVVWAWRMRFAGLHLRAATTQHLLPEGVSCLPTCVRQ